MSPKQLRDITGDSQHVRLSDLVGEVILLVAAERAESRQYGRGVRLEFRRWDEEAGKPHSELCDAFSVAPGVCRPIGRLLAASGDGEAWADPEGVVCEVVMAGAGIALV